VNQFRDPQPSTQFTNASIVKKLHCGEEKKRKKKPQDENIMICPIP